MSEKIKLFYGKHEKQFGQLSIPDSTTPLPIIVVIHGGYWKDKNTLDIYPTKFIVDEFNRSFAIWDLEYRGIPETGEISLETILSDIKQGYEYLTKLTHHNLDLDRILLVGHSAGAHLACWLLGENLSIAPKRAISISGVLDLAQYELLNEPIQVKKLLNHDLKKMPFANPVARGHGETHLTVIHGLEDQTVPYSMATHYADLWDVELLLLEKCGHFSMLPLEEGEYWQTMKNIIQSNMEQL
ncbi:hypothetical protein BIY21_19640 [Vibrio ponticus]|uniref:BD-FAE-like domain-containing protein n=1 Tax=Vibrio ponticus TaxID=265668 RepID=A0ABX3F8T2_9VIBR|nr:alpha/beta hydrolase [Vibrio ponticus]OLQ84940.1 hypothetical protein BIY21_19640 [Vibrio ponticus]